LRRSGRLFLFDQSFTDHLDVQKCLLSYTVPWIMLLKLIRSLIDPILKLKSNYSKIQKYLRISQHDTSSMLLVW
jgi:hypothetical protein